MGTWFSGQQPSRDQAEDELLAESWGLSKSQLSNLKRRFHVLDREHKGYLTRSDFLCLKGLAMNPFADRIIEMFFQNADKSENEEKLYLNEFIQTVLIFRPIRKRDASNCEKINSRENKLKFAYRMFDLDNDGTICKDEILGVLVMMVGPHVDKAKLESIAERALLEVDFDADETMSFEEYQKIMENVAVEDLMSLNF